MPVYIYCLVAAGTILWASAFPVFRSGAHGALTLDRRARWGVALQCVGYSMLWQGAFWKRRPEPWRVGLSMALFAAAFLLSWAAARTLGRHLRVDAAVDSGHQLVQSGPYRVVRHPIYTSMLAVVAATGILVAPLYLFIAGLLTFLVGTEIRMRLEEALLVSRFGDQFQSYRRAVPRLIPFLKEL
jgi:protein-S-isoprenylcysteine O-methyltransferase Ste14